MWQIDSSGDFAALVENGREIAQAYITYDGAHCVALLGDKHLGIFHDLDAAMAAVEAELAQ